MSLTQVVLPVNDHDVTFTVEGPCTAATLKAMWLRTKALEAELALPVSTLEVMHELMPTKYVDYATAIAKLSDAGRLPPYHFQTWEG
jgi:hypothetical protein